MTVSLEFAKRLKDAGWRTPTDYAWKSSVYNPRLSRLIPSGEAAEIEIPYRYDYAPSADEIVNQLWSYLFIGMGVSARDNGFEIVYGRAGGYNLMAAGQTLSDALADLWINLKEEGVL